MPKAKSKSVLVSGTIEISVELKGKLDEAGYKELVLEAIRGALCDLEGVEGEPYADEYQLDVEEQ